MDRPSIDDIILTLRHFGNRAQLLVMPETELSLRFLGERMYAIDRVQQSVAEQYGVHVMLTMEAPGIEPGKEVNEVVLIGPNGVIGSYIKQSLFPREHDATL